MFILFVTKSLRVDKSGRVVDVWDLAKSSTLCVMRCSARGCGRSMRDIDLAYAGQQAKLNRMRRMAMRLALVPVVTGRTRLYRL